MLRCKSIILLSVMAAACGEGKSTLTTGEKSWNPYSINQKLVFRLENGRLDTLEISQVIDGRFPEGIGARANERLRVTAKHRNAESKRLHELSFLYILARWNTEPSKIDFEFFLPDKTFWGRSYPIDELERYKEISIKTSSRTFDDVILIEDNSRRPYSKDDIKVIFWSKSSGYVGFEQYDGSKGELVKIYIDS